jgi:hypothetical protein
MFYLHCGYYSTVIDCVLLSPLLLLFINFKKMQKYTWWYTILSPPLFSPFAMTVLFLFRECARARSHASTTTLLLVVIFVNFFLMSFARTSTKTRLTFYDKFYSILRKSTYIVCCIFFILIQ